MKIIFKDSEGEQPVFGDVRINQFFVHTNDGLYQKSSENSASMIAQFNGRPCSYHGVIGVNEKIQRILPKVEKIEF